jgi:hypothetical protein
VKRKGLAEVRGVRARHRTNAQEQQRQLDSIRRGFAEMEAGHYIPHEAMKGWLLSLGSEHELPPPKCVCGEHHDERVEHPTGKGGTRDGRA